jgi:flagellar basal body-associated protein FliL
MAAEEKAKPEAPAPIAPSPGGGNKMVTILTLVNILVTVGMVAVLVISFQKDRKKPSLDDISLAQEPEGAAKGGGEGHGEEAKHGEGKARRKGNAEFGKMVTLEQFTVNLSTPGSATPMFVRVNISLEVPNDDAENEVNSKMPQVRNAIIDLFNSKRPTDLATGEGRDYLKEEIRNALNSFMMTGKVKGVFFTNFAVSS